MVPPGQYCVTTRALNTRTILERCRLALPWPGKRPTQRALPALWLSLALFRLFHPLSLGWPKPSDIPLGDAREPSWYWKHRQDPASALSREHTDPPW